MTYFEFLDTYGERFLDGFVITIQQTGCAILVAIVIALAMGTMRLAHWRALRYVATGYIELFRGTSLLVQLFWIFYVLPLLGVRLEPFMAGFLAVGMNLGAYGAEVVRGAILAVPRGQTEACIALNMTPFDRLRRIILPQAIVIMLPAWGICLLNS
jgi:polar amino acid transport system permease protein